MFKVLVINAKDEKDICFSKEYEIRADAEKHYRLFKSSMTTQKDNIYREADEQLEKTELKYTDIILYLYENDKRISKFMIG